MALKDSLKNKVNTLQNNTQIEFRKRLSDDIISILNQQIANELQSSQIYRGMACWLDNAGWNNAPKYFMKSADEELTHMKKIYEYLFEKNCKAICPNCAIVQQEFTDIREILVKSLEHEILITSNWEAIAKLADDTNDKTTLFFAQWFLDEQKSEEEKFRRLLYHLDNDMPKWYLDDNFERLTGE